MSAILSQPLVPQGSQPDNPDHLTNRPQQISPQDLSQSARRRLQNDSARLFTPDHIYFEAVKVDRAGSSMLVPGSSYNEAEIYNAKPIDIQISDNKTFEAFLRDNANSSEEDIYIFVRQAHSWSQFQITYEAFTRVLNHFEVDSGFYEFVHSFGLKTSDVDSNFGGYWRQERGSTLDNAIGEGDVISCSIYYLLRYPEKHGRNQKNMWSMRQFAVYQGYNQQTKKSTWLFLQCPKQLQSSFINLVTTNRGESPTRLNRHPNPALLEYLLIKASGKWRDYINDLEAEIVALNEKACYSVVDRTRADQYDYPVGFLDAQKLQGIRRRLFKSIEFLDQALETASGLKEHRRRLHQLGLVSQANSQLNLIKNRLWNYRRNLVSLADFQQGASTLFLKMMDQRNDHVLQRHGETLKQLALQASREGAVMKELSQKMQKDSQVMRVLTSVAFIYLPPSLVAAIFNSNLVQPNLVNPASSGQSHFVLSSQFWLFPLLTISLAAITVISTLVCMKYSTFDRKVLKR